MTKEQFRALVKRFHPDANGGKSCPALTTVLRQWAVQKARRYSRCWCGTLTHGTHCQVHAIRRGARALLTSVALLLLVGCKTPTPATKESFRAAPPPMILEAQSQEAHAPGVTTGTVTVAWDQPPDGQPAGYRVFYYKSPDAGTNSIDIAGDVRTVRITGLSVRTTYKLYCKAFNTDGESPSSNVVIYRVPRK